MRLAAPSLLFRLVRRGLPVHLVLGLKRRDVGPVLCGNARRDSPGDLLGGRPGPAGPRQALVQIRQFVNDGSDIGGDPLECPAGEVAEKQEGVRGGHNALLHLPDRLELPLESLVNFPVRRIGGLCLPLHGRPQLADHIRLLLNGRRHSLDGLGLFGLPLAHFIG